MTIMLTFFTIFLGGYLLAYPILSILYIFFPRYSEEYTEEYEYKGIIYYFFRRIFIYIILFILLLYFINLGLHQSNRFFPPKNNNIQLNSLFNFFPSISIMSLAFIFGAYAFLTREKMANWTPFILKLISIIFLGISLVFLFI